MEAVGRPPPVDYIGEYHSFTQFRGGDYLKVMLPPHGNLLWHPGISGP